jgi:hypothetical protein
VQSTHVLVICVINHSVTWNMNSTTWSIKVSNGSDSGLYCNIHHYSENLLSLSAAIYDLGISSWSTNYATAQSLYSPLLLSSILDYIAIYSTYHFCLFLCALVAHIFCNLSLLPASLMWPHFRKIPNNSLYVTGWWFFKGFESRVSLLNERHAQAGAKNSETL